MICVNSLQKKLWIEDGVLLEYDLFTRKKWLKDIYRYFNIAVRTENFTTFIIKNEIQTSFSTSPGEKPYVCTVPGCEKRFTEYSSLYKHHVVHTPCKPYNCNHCGKTYKQISTLAMHKRTAHNDTEPIEEEQEAYFEPPTGRWIYNDCWLQLLQWENFSYIKKM